MKDKLCDWLGIGEVPNQDFCEKPGRFRIGADFPFWLCAEHYDAWIDAGRKYIHLSERRNDDD